MKKTLLIWRLGGVGDLLWGTPAFPILAKEADIDVVADVRGEAIYRYNPYIRRIIRFEDLRDKEGKPLSDPVSVDKLCINTAVEWWDEYRKQYDYCISAWTATGLALHRSDVFGKKETFYADKAERQTDQNFPDKILAGMGLPWIKGLLPKLYISDEEHQELVAYRKQFAGQKLLLWHTSESAYNKFIPQAVGYIQTILQNCKDVTVLLTGKEHRDFPTHLPDRCISLRDRDLRWQLIMPSIADLVVGPESATINAAAVWTVPKVILFSHTMHKNLSLHWWNVYPIYPNADKCACAPCYRIVSSANADEIDCPVYEADMGLNPSNGNARGKKLGAKCCVYLPHEQVYETIAKIIAGDPGRHCPACGVWQNQWIDVGKYRCVCGAIFGQNVAEVTNVRNEQSNQEAVV